MSYQGSSHFPPRPSDIDDLHLDIESEVDSISSKNTNNTRRYKKYRPITQSFYGLHHHKTQPKPEFMEHANSIRSQTLALNNIGLKPLTGGNNNEENIDNKSNINFGLPLKTYHTLDGTGDDNLPSNHEDENYLQTTNSGLLQGNLSRLLRYKSQQLYDSQDTVDSNNNAYRPSENFGLLFSKRASSLFDNQPYLEQIGERRSLLSNLNENESYEYHTFEDNKSIIENKLDSMPVPDYKNMNWKDYCLLPLTFFPPVFLGLILNFLNAVSYGMIIFPTQIPIFKDFGPDGVAMFLVSTAISQFVYSGFGSGFPCAAGGFMLEVVPFLHIIVNTIIEDIGIENEKSVVATTMIAYALSSIVTGIVFFLLGYFKLGNLVGFFPRHILVGCIGGVGYFLCQTALEVVSGVKLNYFELECWVKFFEPKAIALWGTSICLAVTLKLLQRRINSPILLPFFYMMVPVIFFTIVNLFQLDVEHLRQIGWLFPIPDTSKPFYNFYLHFDFYNTSWSTLPKLVPIMLALTFFGILHVPINVPAVAVTTKTDVYDVNEELIGHGWSNSISGLFGSLQNYLMYSSSVLFFKSGGNDRFAGMMLAIATTLIWTAGPGAVAFIPCIVLGSVIFHLGMELFKEGVYETYGVMTTLEYITIWIIVIAMALLGFVEGVFVGIALACLFFVYLYSQRTPIRSSYSGRAAKSTVRRVYKQRQFLDQASTLIHVIKLQGFMFFGTIDSVEATIRDLISDRQWSQKPLSFLILDLTLVTGVDFSAAEAFIRIRRLLTGKKVFMILCGVTPESDVGMALHAVGIWEIQDGLSQTFETLNNALEWCENKLLEAAYMRHSNSTAPAIDVSNNQLSNSMLPLAMSNSPRTAHLDLVRKETLVTDNGISTHFQQPLALLVQMFSEAQPTIDEAIFKLVPYFKHALKNRGETLWNDGDPADCFYILETGLLKVYTKLENGKNKMIESILPGAMVGELALFTNLPRPYTVITDDHCSLWCLDRDAFDSLSKDEPAVLIRFMQLALAYSVQEMNIYTLNVMAL